MKGTCLPLSSALHVHLEHAFVRAAFTRLASEPGTASSSQVECSKPVRSTQLKLASPNKVLPQVSWGRVVEVKQVRVAFQVEVIVEAATAARTHSCYAGRLD